MRRLTSNTGCASRRSGFNHSTTFRPLLLWRSPCQPHLLGLQAVLLSSLQETPTLTRLRYRRRAHTMTIILCRGRCGKEMSLPLLRTEDFIPGSRSKNTTELQLKRTGMMLKSTAKGGAWQHSAGFYKGTCLGGTAEVHSSSMQEAAAAGSSSKQATAVHNSSMHAPAAAGRSSTRAAPAGSS